MPRERRDIASALSNKGFRKADGRDHDYFWLFVGETKQQIYTKLSRGTSYRTIDDSLLGKIARQLHLKKPQFLALVDCNMDGAEYVKCLTSQGVLVEASQPDPK